MLNVTKSRCLPMGAALFGERRIPRWHALSFPSISELKENETESRDPGLDLKKVRMHESQSQSRNPRGDRNRWVNGLFNFLRTIPGSKWAILPPQTVLKESFMHEVCQWKISGQMPEYIRKFSVKECIPESGLRTGSLGSAVFDCR